jgi:alkylation response protein AidB-like acyl-CoA dehydrogenase
MHPAVAAFWLNTPQAAPPFEDAWAQQRRWVSQSAMEGAWWGTIISEPGSGGDQSQSKAVARYEPSDKTWRLTGQKHFGSGSGIASYMITTALPSGAPEPDGFFFDMRGVLNSSGVPKEEASGIKLVAPWDGHGMTATQSHGFLFDGFPATRFAWPGNMQAILPGGFAVCCFSAVIVGIVETAMATAKRQLEPRRESLRAYEQVEWVRAEMEAWLIAQAYAGMLRAVEAQDNVRQTVNQGKTAIAGLAESALQRICRIIGGGTFARQSPYGCWLEDVRALGFLRPPWGLAYDRLFEGSWESPA